jgi:hypothetical protein
LHYARAFDGPDGTNIGTKVSPRVKEHGVKKMILGTAV